MSTPSKLRALTDDLWSGARHTDHASILTTMLPLEEVAPGVAFHSGFASAPRRRSTPRSTPTATSTTRWAPHRSRPSGRCASSGTS